MTSDDLVDQIRPSIRRTPDLLIEEVYLFRALSNIYDGIPFAKISIKHI